jgi:ubiquinone/menaquinone biosynthesis C-methylase UbiE
MHMVTRARQLSLKLAEEVLLAYLGTVPVAHALFRAAEAHHLSEAALTRPVLDLGCGAGEFAVYALLGQLDVGLDIAPGQLRRARATGRYGRLEQGDARHMPFSDRQFSAVLAVSVLEHIRCLEEVLTEIYRVLRPGGRLVATIVLADLHRHLFYPKLCRCLGLRALGHLYTRWQDRLLRHQTLLGQQEWEGLLTRAGFQIAVSRKIISPALTAWWDGLLPLALPYHLGRFPVWHPRWLRARIQKLFRRLLADENDEGSNLLVVAQRPVTSRTVQRNKGYSKPARSASKRTHAPAASYSSDWQNHDSRP